MTLRPNALQSVALEADPDRQRARCQRGQRAVEIAAAVAQAITGGIEAVQGQKNKLGQQPLTTDRRRYAITVGLQQRPRLPAPKGERRIDLDHDRQGSHRPQPQPVLDHCLDVRFAFDRPAESRDPGQRQYLFQVRDDARRKLGTHFLAQSGAPNHHLTPQRPSPGRVILVQLIHKSNLA